MKLILALAFVLCSTGAWAAEARVCTSGPHEGYLVDASTPISFCPSSEELPHQIGILAEGSTPIPTPGGVNLDAIPGGNAVLMSASPNPASEQGASGGFAYGTTSSNPAPVYGAPIPVSPHCDPGWVLVYVSVAKDGLGVPKCAAVGDLKDPQ